MAKNHPSQMVARDYRKLVKAATDAGWEFVPTTKGGHPKLIAPDGWSTPLPGTSHRRSGLYKAIVARCRKHGLTL